MSQPPEISEKDPLSPRTKALLSMIQALLPVMTAIFGGLWITYTFLVQQRESQIAFAENAKREARTQIVQSQRPFLEKQLALYFEAAQVAGKLTVFTPDDKEWDPTESRFWELYWSELSMVEDRDVERAMVIFGDCLHDYTSARARAKNQKKPFEDLQEKHALDSASLDLAHQIRKSIESAWRINPSAKE
jgi:hypothetical protein